MDIDALSEGLVFDEYVKGQEKEFEKKLKDEGLLLAYKTLLKSPDGKRVLWDILELCKVFHLSMTGNSWTYFNEGTRHVGLYIMTMLNLVNNVDDVLNLKKLIKND